MADRLLGSFVWCELMTTDSAAADSFYRKVVGWTSAPFTPDGSYTVFNNAAGGGVGGVMKLPDDAKQAGTPNWMMYVGTPNVDATALKVAQLGGRVLRQPENIANAGRFAVVQDPFGATFGLYMPGNAVAGNDSPGLGDFSWFELYTPNPEGAWNFYQSLFGWEKTSAMDMGEMGSYQMFGRGGGVPSGGLMKPPPGAPVAWVPYARVKDARAAAAAATANGGKIINGPMEVPGGDWIAQGIDPQGAMFSVHSLNPGARTREPGTGTAAKTAPAKKPAKKKTAAKKAALKKKAKGGRQKAQGTRQKAKGTRQKAKGTRQKAKGTRQKAKGKKKAATKKAAKKTSKRPSAKRKK